MSGLKRATLTLWRHYWWSQRFLFATQRVTLREPRPPRPRPSRLGRVLGNVTRQVETVGCWVRPNSPCTAKGYNVTATRFRLTTLGALVALLVVMLTAPALGQPYPPPPGPPDDPPSDEPPPVDVGGVGFEVICPPAEGGDPVPQLRWSVTDDDVGIDEGDLTVNVFFTRGQQTETVRGVPFEEGGVLWPGTELDDDGNPVRLPGFTRGEGGNWFESDLDAFPRGNVNVVFNVEGLPDDDDLDVSALRNSELELTYPFEGEDCDPEPTGVEDEDEEREPGPPEDPGPADRDDVEIEDRDEASTEVLGVTIPRTGGELLVLLALGATLVLGGAVVLVARRRPSDPMN